MNRVRKATAAQASETAQLTSEFVASWLADLARIIQGPHTMKEPLKLKEPLKEPVGRSIPV